MAQANLVRFGNLVQVYPDYHLLLAPELQYRRRKMLGGDASDVEYVQTYLYKLEGGALLAPAGMMTRIAKTLRDSGVEPIFSDRRPQILPPPDYSRIDKLRPGQDGMLLAALTHDMGVIQGPTGAGKSFLIKQLCKVWPEANIIICSPFTRVVKRFYSDLHEVLGPNEVGLMGAGGHDRARVTVTTQASLGKCDLDKVDLFIFDEVHKAAAEKTAALLAEIRLARMLGFSASPKGRSDGADRETEALFGPIIHKADYKSVQDAGNIAPIDVYLAPCSHVEPINYSSTNMMNRHGIWRNKGRIDMVVYAVRWALEKFGQDSQIMVSAMTVDHAIHLGAALPDFAVCYGSMDTDDRDKYARWGLLDPSKHPLTAKDREALEEGMEAGTLKRAIATTTSGGVWSTGVDFPQLKIMVRADSQSGSILNTQIPGRLSRISEGKDKGILIDFDDAFDSGLQRRAERRLASYRGKGWTLLPLPHAQTTPS